MGRPSGRELPDGTGYRSHGIEYHKGRTRGRRRGTRMRVGVVGCGLMGSGIAEVCARAGLDVVVVEADRQRVDAGRERLAASLQRAEARGKLDDAAAVLERISLGHDPAALADREIVVEAIAENEQLKVEMFALIDKIVES